VLQKNNPSATVLYYTVMY